MENNRLTIPKIIHRCFNKKKMNCFLFEYIRKNNLPVIANGIVGITGIGLVAPFVVIAIASDRSVGGNVCGNGNFF